VLADIDGKKLVEKASFESVTYLCSLKHGSKLSMLLHVYLLRNGFIRIGRYNFKICPSLQNKWHVGPVTLPGAVLCQSDLIDIDKQWPKVSVLSPPNVKL